MQSKNWQSLGVTEVLQELKTTKTGLSEEEAGRRLRRFGENLIPPEPRFTYLGVALSQLRSPLVYILLLAAALSFILGEYVDVGVILFAVFLNTVLGFMQEIKAEQSLAALSSVVPHRAYVLRDGIEKEVDAAEVVPGDILVLKAGGRIAADGRLLETYELEADEATLTGEAVPVRKISKLLHRPGANTQQNLVYMGTTVSRGRGLAAVIATGSDAEFGQIARLLQTTREADTPLQQELGRFSADFSRLTFLALLILLAIGLYRGVPFIEMFTTAVAIAVAAVPEGMLVAVTVILAIGMQRILHSGSLVKKLLAAETLGSVSLICTDKTGTLTTGDMRIDHIVTLHSLHRLGDGGENDAQRSATSGDHLEVLRIGLICNDAVVENPGAELADWVIHGDYTEKAFLEAGIGAGLDPVELARQSVRLNEIPFSSERKLMATLNREQGKLVVYVKGAAEEVVNRSRRILADGRVREMHEDDLRYLKRKQAEMSREGLRVLGVAYRHLEPEEKVLFKESNEDEIASGLTFVGLVAIKDPLRPEARATLDGARAAGIRTVIITGDNALTACSIARELGMRVEEENVLTGEQLDQMSTKDLDRLVPRIKVYARVSPRHKLRIVQAWQARGEVVAMTGDGVNDAPALKQADIGVALGSGTEVAKQTAGLVLLDDNFKTIIEAVREGRVIFANIRKVILYLISDSFSEVVVVGGSLLAGLTLPVTAAQILWINLITDGLPNLALTFEPEGAGIMDEPPRGRDEPLLNREMKLLVLVISLVSGAVALTLFALIFQLTGDFLRASSIAFSILAVDSLIYVFNLRDLRCDHRQDPFSNPYLIVAVLVAFGFQLLAIYHPFLQRVLSTAPLSFSDWCVVVLASLFTTGAAEMTKHLYAGCAHSIPKS